MEFALLATLAASVAGSAASAIAAFLTARLRGATRVRVTGTLDDRISVAQESLNSTIHEISESFKNASAELDRELTSVRTVVDDLEGELRTRKESLAKLADEVQGAEEQLNRAQALAKIEEASAEAISSMVDQQLGNHLRREGRKALKVNILIGLAGLLLGIPTGLFVSWLASGW
jgi:predicted nuclease with TOPRIM domain